MARKYNLLRSLNDKRLYENELTRSGNIRRINYKRELEKLSKRGELRFDYTEARYNELMEKGRGMIERGQSVSKEVYRYFRGNVSIFGRFEKNPITKEMEFVENTRTYKEETLARYDSFRYTRGDEDIGINNINKISNSLRQIIEREYEGTPVEEITIENIFELYENDLITANQLARFIRSWKESFDRDHSRDGSL